MLTIIEAILLSSSALAIGICLFRLGRYRGRVEAHEQNRRVLDAYIHAAAKQQAIAGLHPQTVEEYGKIISMLLAIRNEQSRTRL